MRSIFDLEIEHYLEHDIVLHTELCSSQYVYKFVLFDSTLVLMTGFPILYELNITLLDNIQAQVCLLSEIISLQCGMRGSDFSKIVVNALTV